MDSSNLQNLEIYHKDKEPVIGLKGHISVLLIYPHIFGNKQTKHTTSYKNSITDKTRQTQIFAVLIHAVSKIIVCLYSDTYVDS